jgi:hypothetical protein
MAFSLSELHTSRSYICFFLLLLSTLFAAYVEELSALTFRHCYLQQGVMLKFVNPCAD